MLLLFLKFMSCSTGDASIEYSDSGQTIISAVYTSDVPEPIVVIPSKVVKIESENDLKYAFFECSTTVTQVTFEDESSLETVGSYCFYQCTKLKIANLSSCSKVTYINSYAFYGCSSLVEMYFPPNLLYLGNFVYGKCISIVDVILPTSTISAGESCFRSCTSINIFNVPPNLETFGKDCFSSCSSLTSFSFIGETKLKTYGDWSLMGTKLQTLVIPSSMTNPGNCVVEGNSNVQGFDIIEPSNFAAEQGILYDKNFKILYFALCSISGVIDIKNTVTTLSANAFKSCTKITEITVPDSVNVFIQSCHFAACRSLTKITLGKNIPSISTEMFDGCSSIPEIEVISPIKSVGASAFRNCLKLMKLTLPSTVTSFGGNAFQNTPTDITISFGDGATVFLENNHLYSQYYNGVMAFIGTDGDIVIPSNATFINPYTYYAKSISSVTFESDCTLESIGEYAFSKCTKLKSIALPKSVTTIYNEAFSSCSLLTSITLGESLERIPTKCFAYSKIVSITIPASVTEIQSCAFQDTPITTVTFESLSSLTKIGNLAFYRTKSLTGIKLPASTSTIDLQCFLESGIKSIDFDETKVNEISVECLKDCRNLSKLILPPNCLSISDRSFENCVSLVSISLPSSVRNITTRAFSGCTELSDFFINEKSQLEVIMGQAFYDCKKLEDFNVNPNSGFVSEGGILYDQDQTKIIAYLSANPRNEIQIKDSVSIINSFAFQLAVNIEHVIIPSSITKIGFRAFDGCESIISLDIRSPSLELGLECFKGCKGLECGSVLADISLNEDLIQAGIPSVAVLPCPTQEYNVTDSQLYLLISVIFSDDSA